MVLNEQGIIAAIQDYLDTRACTRSSNQSHMPRIRGVTLRPARESRNENEIIVHFEDQP